MGGYRVLRRLGEGGMGVVYLAEGPSRVQVAVKVIHRHLAREPDFRRRFRREVAAARRVAPFSTAPVIDADVDGDTAYLVTEYVPGPTLFETVSRRGPLAGSALEGLAMSMAVALRAIHAADVIHRDLKPSNVLLSPVGPKVIDFGLATLPDTSTHSMTVMGTPAYMSPEHVRGLTISASSDMFSWAGVVVFAACGQPPFGAGAGHEVLYRVVHDAPRLPPLDGVLGELVTRALDKDPAARPTAAEVIETLAAGTAHRQARATGAGMEVPPAPSPARRRSWWPAPARSLRRFAPSRLRRRLARSRASSRRRAAGTRRLLWAGAGAAVLALGTAGAIAGSRLNLSLVPPPLAPRVSATTEPPARSTAERPAAGNEPTTGTAGSGPTTAPPGDTPAARPVTRPAGDNPLDAGGVRFYVQPDTDAARQARTWSAQGRTADGSLMRALSRIPQAMWLTGGSPADVTRVTRTAVAGAAQAGTVPVFVTNHIPGRDCWNGGAASPRDYQAWIDAVAEGIGGRPAVVMLEPSSLARMPGSPQCPQGGEEAGRQRYSDLSYAVRSLGALRHTAVYLDGGLDGWPAFGDTADRLLNAGLRRADGFYVNMVGYRTTERSLAYGVRMSKCLYLKTASRTATCAPAQIADVPDGLAGLPHFVVDTSRNGRGEWAAPRGRYPVPDEWCNPPGRGAGARPTTGTGHRLADALLWLNSPGFSNGRCTRGTSGPADPVYGLVTPAAGQWWPDRALDQAKNAVPPLIQRAPGGR
ncbi:glycoside hydrolase family 6 protein [Sphaerisporangium melleum]|uniref:glycoside hydrolase family 6 protein n=1 Tax=Sphaerisporangium melleum TaxID=321316 RepID=UPI00166340BD|nr:glycoside hydrolase family 6 protein [Sphaerisporangium melleum]